MIFASTASLDANGHLIHRAILRNDIGKVVFDLCVAADTIPAWLDGFVEWARIRIVQRLMNCASVLAFGSMPILAYIHAITDFLACGVCPGAVLR